MRRDELVVCLSDVLKPDTVVRNEAERRILEMQAVDFGNFALFLVEILCDLGCDNQLKMIAGIILKNSFHANSLEIQRSNDSRWLGLQTNIREHIKDVLRGALGGPVQKFCVVSGLLLGQIARIEICKGLYIDFFEEMRRRLYERKALYGVFEAVGVCSNRLAEEPENVFSEYKQTIFEISMYSLESEASRDEVLAGLRCLMNSIDILDVFHSKRNEERLFAALTRIWNGDDEELICKSMICLNRFVTLNYRLICRETLENILMQCVGRFMRMKSDEIRVQAIEYWCIFADEKDEDIIDRYFNVVFKEVLELLRKDSSYCGGAWSPHKAAASCLETFTTVKKKSMISNKMIQDFIESELRSEQGSRIDTGATALGCVMYQEYESYLADAVPYLVSGIEHRESEESSLWTLSKMAELNFYALSMYIPAILEKCSGIMQMGQAHSTGAIWVMECIFCSIKKSKTRGFSRHVPEVIRRGSDESVDMFLKERYLDILNVLVKGVEVASLEDPNLRIALFSALTGLVAICPRPISNVLDEFYKYTSRKIEECLNVIGCATQNQLLIVEDVLSNYIGLIEAITAAINKDDVEDLVILFIRILDSVPTSAFGEVYIAMSKLSAKFSPYMSRIIPHVTRDMTCTDKFVLRSVINFVGTQASAMDADFNIFAAALTSSLIQCLGSEATPRDLKPMILSVLGDIALALEKNFEPYFEMIIILLSQISELERKSDEEFVDNLRRDAVLLINCSLVALRGSSKVKEVASQIMNSIHRIHMEDVDRVSNRNILSLIEDLACTYGRDFCLDDAWVKDFLYDMEIHGCDEDQRKAGYILKVLR